MTPTPHHDHDVDDHDRGLQFDLGTLMARRKALRVIAGAALVPLAAACGASSNGSSSSGTSASSSTGGSTADGSSSAGAATTSAVAATAVATCEAPIPEETAGPYPGDGSNGVDVLTESGIVRSDIRSSFGSASGVADGVPLTIRLRVLDDQNGCAPLAGAAVYLWHCDREGRYSLYSDGVTQENYLRGVQETDADGMVSFTTIYPACYSGRWPHAHFEVYPSVDEATGGGSLLATSQLALPQETCEVVYANDGYDQSVANLARVSLQSDNVFGDDGAVRQLAELAGSVDEGYTATLDVPV